MCSIDNILPILTEASRYDGLFLLLNSHSVALLTLSLVMNLSNFLKWHAYVVACLVKAFDSLVALGLFSEAQWLGALVMSL